MAAAAMVVDADDGLEEEMRREDDGCDGAACGPAERTGLTAGASDAERIRKFGSSRAARLAVAFA